MNNPKSIDENQNNYNITAIISLLTIYPFLVKSVVEDMNIKNKYPQKSVNPCEIDRLTGQLICRGFERN